LNVTGLYIDTVTHSSGASSDDDSFGDIHDQWYSTLLEASGSLQGFTKDIRLCLAEISSTVRQYSEYFSSKDVNSNLPAGAELDPLITEAYILDAYIQSLLCGRISSSERITREDIEALMSFQPPQRSPPATNQEFVTKICNAFEAGMRRRKLAVTKDGFIGAVPQGTEPEDLICVLFGCSVPIVLRKAVSDKATMPETPYKFIGEAYLHGFMDAEAIVMLKKETRNVQHFSLK
jgi:hypothetical protein